MELYRVIDFDARHGNCGGTLLQFQPGEDKRNALPFPIRKVLYMTDIRENDVRGRHAHHRTCEILVALRGSCTVDLDDGRGTSASLRLSRPDQALLLHPHVWRTMKNFARDTALLVIADTPYDEKDYIRDREDFERLARAWKGLEAEA